MTNKQYRILTMLSEGYTHDQIKNELGFRSNNLIHHIVIRIKQQHGAKTTAQLMFILGQKGIPLPVEPKKKDDMYNRFYRLKYNK